MYYSGIRKEIDLSADHFCCYFVLFPFHYKKGYSLRRHVHSYRYNSVHRFPFYYCFFE